MHSYVIFVFLTSLCTSDARFIHIVTNDSIFSFLWLSNIPYADIENGLVGIGGQKGWEELKA